MRRLLGDAVAVITGRPVETVDALLGDAVFAVAGEHGGAIRHAPGEPVERPHLPSPPERLARRSGTPGGGSIPARCWNARRAASRCITGRCPPLARRCAKRLSRLLAGSAEFELLPAHMLWEVRPRGADKGKAVAALMDRAPFLGRLPVFIGDDVTDEDGIAAAEAMGGVGLRVHDVFGDAAGVRAWLQAIASSGDWPQGAAPIR